MINIIGSVSQWEREVIAERTSTALQELKEQGRSTGNPAFGFSFVDGPRVENGEEQAVLARVAELRDQGTSWQLVADTLNGEGIRTRAGGAPYSLANLVACGAGPATLPITDCPPTPGGGR